MKEVQVRRASLDRLIELLPPERGRELRELAERTRRRLAGRTVWQVNSTAAGGGVAELLGSLLGYALDAGVDTRWVVIDGTPEFFAITKRLHNALHGGGAPPGADERREYEQVLGANAERLRQLVRRGDLVVLHDPQTAGLIGTVAGLGGIPIWRCHVGRDDETRESAQAWSFLRPYLEPARALVFSRGAYAPSWVDPARLVVIPPSIDPFTPKNRPVDGDSAQDVLTRAGLLAKASPAPPVAGEGEGDLPPEIPPVDQLVHDGPLPGPEHPLVTQVARWDRLKDPLGVLEGFARYVAVDGVGDARLLLAGPSVTGVSDDPEAGEVFGRCVRAWEGLPDAARRRVMLATLPMEDLVANAVTVNALQRHASVVVQKSLAEGFGLTVVEAMWKGRPVVASAVGGIRDQVEHERNGLLLDDPADLATFGAAVRRLLADPGRAERLGAAGHQRVVERFLPDRQLAQWARLLVACC